MADNPLGAYNTQDYVACTNCGQLSRIEFCYPLVQASTITRAYYCPMCGLPRTTDNKFSNSASFELIAQVMFGRKSSPEEAQQLKEIYGMWNAHEYSTFKDFLKELSK